MRQLKISQQITNRDSNAFNKYLNEVSSVGRVISIDEEIELTKKIKAGDVDARNKLCEANLKFVISVAKQYSGQAPLNDLISEGNIGLLKAADKFDETRGFKFISYAVWWIRQSILQYLAESGRQIRLPLNKIGIVNKINQTKIELEQVYQRQPTIDEISDFLMTQEEDKGKLGDPSKYTEDKIISIINSSTSLTSLDAPIGSEYDSESLANFIEGDSEYDVKEIMSKKDLDTELGRVVSTLKDREKMVLILFYGLFGSKTMSLDEIGRKLDLTRERVRQIRENGIRSLKSKSRRTNLKEFL